MNVNFLCKQHEACLVRPRKWRIRYVCCLPLRSRPSWHTRGEVMHPVFAYLIDFATPQWIVKLECREVGKCDNYKNSNFQDWKHQSTTVITACSTITKHYKMKSIVSDNKFCNFKVSYGFPKKYWFSDFGIKLSSVLCFTIKIIIQIITFFE